MSLRIPIYFALGCALAGSAAAAPAPTTLDRLRAEFRNPPREFTQIPFWFWNGRIDEAGIRREIADMESHGVHGFLIHARMGLDKDIGYMTDRWLQLVRFAVEEAAARKMIVYLYDEAMYPSGSAHGKVVEKRPSLASQGLRMTSMDITGPKHMDIDFTEQPVSAVLVQREAGKYLPGGRAVPLATPLDVPAGDWTLFTFTQVPSGGVIRGPYPDEEDNKPNAPPSADLLNSEATAAFIAETHEKYYAAVGPHFGKTVRAIFTDEPSILGRRSKRGLQPWTAGLLPKISRTLGYDFEPWLPFLWVPAADGTEALVRADFKRAVEAALNESYYRPLYDWCTKHNIDLTGHPAGSGDMAPQAFFHAPGQDTVLRWVLPGRTALEGENSLIGKTASSMALHLDRPIVMNECYGAYGWQLTMSEIKWLTDWLAVRGANQFVPHAFYYSGEGDRLQERPPDLSWFNLWWPHYGLLSAYTNRLSWLMRGGAPVADVAILGGSGSAPWRAAKVLFENQTDFYYLDESLLDRARAERGCVQVGRGSYSVLLLDGVRILAPSVLARLAAFMDAGVRVAAYDCVLQLHPLHKEYGAAERALLDRVLRHANFKTVAQTDLAQLVPQDVKPAAPAPGLRYTHRVRNGIHLYLLTNEGDRRIRTNVSFRAAGVPEIWDPETGTVFTGSGPSQIALDLFPRGSIVVAFGPGGRRPAAPAREETVELPGLRWTLAAKDQRFDAAPLGTWTALPGMESFSGTAWYAAAFDAPAIPKGARVLIDCGDVRDFAEISINGRSAGVRLWQPFRFDVTALLKPGANEIRIGVTNTRANELTRLKQPSGLFGPVRLVFSRPGV